MECYIFSCPIKENEFLIMSANQPLALSPPEVKLDYKNPEIIKTINLETDSNFIGLNSTVALESLETDNYYIFNSTYGTVMNWDGVDGIAMEESVEIPINVPE